jgi:purine-binding chemotaxis protein CheW
VSKQYIAFKLGKEEYAVDILAVKEIIRWTHMTRVPRAPSFIYGVINLRGNVIPVFNTHLRLQLPTPTLTAQARIIIFQVEDLVVGLSVDQVVEVISLNADKLKKPQMVEGDHRFLENIGKVGDRLIMILDLAKIFDLKLC